MFTRLVVVMAAAALVVHGVSTSEGLERGLLLYVGGPIVLLVFVALFLVFASGVCVGRVNGG